MKDYIIKKFSENLSWAGIFLIGSAFGLDLTPFQEYAITFFGMVMFGADDVKLRRLLRPAKAK